MNIIKGNSTKEQIEYIDVILTRMFRRLNKRIVALVPRIPIFGNMIFSESGVVLKCVSPASGKIVRGHVVIVPNKNVGTKKRFEFSATISNVSGIVTHLFEARPGSTSMVMDLEVAEGDFITIKATSPEDIEDMVVSIVYEVVGRDTITKKFLIEELERGADEGIREDNLK